MTDLGLLGPEYTFHDLARRRFLSELKHTYYSSFDEVFNALKSGEIKQALIALRNSHSGDVNTNGKLIQNKGLKLLKEFDLEVNLCLGGFFKNNISSIQKIHSHPMAIKETRDYFSKYSHIKFISSKSTAGAIEELRNGRDKRAAVISSKEALIANSLSIVAENIQDSNQNVTTFGLVSH